MQTLTKSILSIFGFIHIYSAFDGEEGFATYKERMPDLIITDWLMEPMDGIEMIEKIRRDPNSPDPYVPIILMTGYSDRLRVEKARDMGVTEFLMKPFTARDLYSRIVQVIEKPRQFVDAGAFFGPDRRRRQNIAYSGPYKREEDKSTPPPETSQFDDKEADLILQDLRKTIRKE